MNQIEIQNYDAIDNYLLNVLLLNGQCNIRPGSVEVQHFDENAFYRLRCYKS